MRTENDMRDRVRRGVDWTIFAVGLFSLTTAIAGTALTRLSDDMPDTRAVIAAPKPPVG